MWLVKLAWKNLWRNRSRTAITVSAIFFAVVLSITTSSLQDGVFGNFIRNMVSFYSGYIQVHQAGYWDQQILDNSMERSTNVEKIISEHSNVISIAPRLESYALASAGDLTKGCLVVGILPDPEDKITFLKSKVQAGEYLEPNDKETVLMAEGLAERLNLQLHDTVILISQGYHGSVAAGKYFIKGILHFGSPELNDQLLHMPLATAQDFFSAPDLLTAYVLSLKDADQLQTTAKVIQRSIGNNYEALTWEEMMPEVQQHIKTDKGSMYIIQAILYMLICFGIFGTLLMMMAERKYEMGMLIAIGMKKWKLILVMLMESTLNVLVGCIAGMLASAPIVVYLNRYPIRFSGDMAEMYKSYGFEAIFPTSVNAEIFFKQGIIVLVLGLVLSIYPLMKIWNLNPVTAMKK
jgi:ABC-type lipoprotein release transport system permease subunit